MTSSGRGTADSFPTRIALAWSVCSLLAAFAAGCGPHEGKLVVEKWTTLAEGSWSLLPGTEDAGWCTTVVVPEEMYVAAIRPIASAGTHHIGLTIAGADDGDDCTKGQFGPGTLYAAGPGAGELRMPAGVAMKLAAKQSLHLNLHVYNATASVLEGVSGLEVVRAKAGDIVHEAGFVLAGPTSVTLPPAKRTTITKTCSIVSEQTAVALIPLMHKLGVQFKTTATQSGTPRVLFDAAFRYEEQSQVPLAALALVPGDTITTECTYENTKYHPVIPGHPGDEICFSALLRYPQGAAIACEEPNDSAPDR
ncbi:MAG: hypothetical protein ABW133_15570 [Polyangiaceae bacterium]